MSHIKKAVFFLLVCCLSPVFLFAQNWEFGGLLGGSYYYGDVSNDNFPVTENIRGAGFGFARYHMNSRMVVRMNLGFVRIAGMDSLSSDASQRDRNLNFFTDIYELSGQFEYNLVSDRTRGRRIIEPVIPYVFGGLGISYFVPKTIWLGQEWNLADLQTSGMNYSQFTLVVPVGVGVRCYLTPRWQIGAELGFRFTSTSDLDDIRGNSTYPDPLVLPGDDSRRVHDRSTAVPYNEELGYGYGVPGKERGQVDYITDIYMVYGITVSYKFSTMKRSRFGGGAVRCPRFF